jgi:hypothetical protein
MTQHRRKKPNSELVQAAEWCRPQLPAASSIVSPPPALTINRGFTVEGLAVDFAGAFRPHEVVSPFAKNRS